MFYALFILLSCNSAVYGTLEHERQEMNQSARLALEEILSTAEFRDQSPQPPWWLRLAEYFMDHLPAGAGWMGNMLEWLLYLIAALVTISVFVFIARRLRRLPSLTIDHDVPIGTQLRMDPAAARKQAYECSQRGDYRQAIRYLYLSFLLHLDKVGLLTYNTSKTNGEILSEACASIGNKAQVFAFLTLSFERKWYGMEESSAADFQQCEEAVDRLMGL